MVAFCNKLFCGKKWVNTCLNKRKRFFVMDFWSSPRFKKSACFWVTIFGYFGTLQNYVPHAPSRLSCFGAFAPYVSYVLSCLTCLRVLCAFAPSHLTCVTNPRALSTHLAPLFQVLCTSYLCALKSL